MKNPDHAELVENHIAMRDMYAFVCENQEDNQKYELVINLLIIYDLLLI